MFRLLILISLFLTGCSSTEELSSSDHISGKWSYSEIGNDYENTKICEFLISDKLVCSITEAGFSNGFGDAHIYKTTGTWNIVKNELTLTETATYNPKEKKVTKYSIKRSTMDKMLLINNQGVQQIWLKTN
jgi:hypothetical protein